MISCNKKTPVEHTKASQVRSTADNLEILQDTCDKSPKSWHEITGEEIEEDIFLENLDVDMLETIAQQFQSLVSDIEAHQFEDPESVLRAEWINDYKNSIQYNYVVDLGIKAVKPMYYILYKCEQAGLYEYIICSAINDITQYHFSNSDNYRWSDAYEFRQLYNEKVKTTIEQFYRLLNDNSMDPTAQTDSIIELGIFSIPLLLNELDSRNSSLNPQQITSCIKSIYHQFSDNQIDDLNAWRNMYEEYFRGMIEIL